MSTFCPRSRAVRKKSANDVWCVRGRAHQLSNQTQEASLFLHLSSTSFLVVSDLSDTYYVFRIFPDIDTTKVFFSENMYHPSRAKKVCYLRTNHSHLGSCCLPSIISEKDVVLVDSVIQECLHLIVEEKTHC